jgi:hypothetical protein
MLVKPCRESMLFPDLRTPNPRHMGTIATVESCDLKTWIEAL